jgi:hypothetical protein
LIREPEGRDYSENLGHRWEDNIKMDLGKSVFEERGLDSSASEYGLILRILAV